MRSCDSDLFCSCDSDLFCSCDFAAVILICFAFSSFLPVTNTGLNELQIAFVCREILKVSNYSFLIGDCTVQCVNCTQKIHC